ncbi:MAG: ATP-binding protein [bacterium]
MRRKLFRSLYGKISAVFLLLLLLLGVVQILISLNSFLDFVRESDQLLNRHLAKDLANELRPFLQDSLETHSIEHTIHHLMVMNPRVEIYLLDSRGKILAFFADPKKKVKLESVSLEPVNDFLANRAAVPILGDDPRHLGGKKTFSAAAIKIGQHIDGYLYIILGGERYDSASAMIQESYILRTTATSLAVTFLFTGLAGLILFAFLTRRFHVMTRVVKKFELGDLKQRITVKSNDEIGELSQAFNQMADTIEANVAELKRTDRLRRELIANVSHDLRSPLASVQGYLETILMKEGVLDQKERLRYLQIIFENTKKLGALVGELFELSKLDAKQVHPKPEPFSMAELTQDVVMKFQLQAEKQKVKLQSSLPKDLPAVYADIGLIERALSNLIDNALRFTPESGTVKIDLLRHEDQVQVVVADTGCGIPSDEIPLVFERFYRMDKSPATSATGTGLGLAIAKRILDLHNSAITVQSEVNVGTTFSFNLRVFH